MCRFGACGAAVLRRTCEGVPTLSCSLSSTKHARHRAAAHMCHTRALRSPAPALAGSATDVGGPALSAAFHASLEDSAAAHFSGNSVINCMCGSTGKRSCNECCCGICMGWGRPQRRTSAGTAWQVACAAALGSMRGSTGELRMAAAASIHIRGCHVAGGWARMLWHVCCATCLHFQKAGSMNAVELQHGPQAGPQASQYLTTDHF